MFYNYNQTQEICSGNQDIISHARICKPLLTVIFPGNLLILLFLGWHQSKNNE